MDSGAAFNGYEEGPLIFRPTYRYDVGTDTYDTSEKMRIPAWTGGFFDPRNRGCMIRGVFSKIEFCIVALHLTSELILGQNYQVLTTNQVCLLVPLISWLFSRFSFQFSLFTEQRSRSSIPWKELPCRVWFWTASHLRSLVNCLIRN